MNVIGNDITTSIRIVPASGTRTPRSVYETVSNVGDRATDTKEQKEDTAAFSVRISDQAQAKQEFERNQQQEAAVFERQARRNESEFEREQQQEEEAFNQAEARKRTEFMRNQQQAAAAFYRNQLGKEAL